MESWVDSHWKQIHAHTHTGGTTLYCRQETVRPASLSIGIKVVAHTHTHFTLWKRSFAHLSTSSSEKKMEGGSAERGMDGCREGEMRIRLDLVGSFYQCDHVTTKWPNDQRFPFFPFSFFSSAFFVRLLLNRWENGAPHCFFSPLNCHLPTKIKPWMERVAGVMQPYIPREAVLEGFDMLQTKSFVECPSIIQ